MFPDVLLALDELSRLMGAGLPPDLRAIPGVVEPPVAIPPPRPGQRPPCDDRLRDRVHG